VVDGDIVQEVEMASPVDAEEAPAAVEEEPREQPQPAPRPARRKRVAKPGAGIKAARDKKSARPRAPRKKPPVPVGV
jgi:hypothetical protein